MSTAAETLVVCTLHWYFDPSHLDDVAGEMLVRGPPSLRGFHDEETGFFLLREGTHRIKAAHRLVVAPVLVRIPWWRSKASLSRARYAARERGLLFRSWTYQ